jgi:hypothetical protein
MQRRITLEKLLGSRLCTKKVVSVILSAYLTSKSYNLQYL